ncbi:MAG: CoB--CoM heterodisulfide reductase iron-sulfur subunit B family protein [Deltaproteobacteria bacterium]|nr:CoB--CoM heterodisulfide reductase iron-sulfur subunit B family protein [Deltaproteobacteria bacterium]
MKYIYYPGCSLEGTAREYDLSTRALLKAIGVELHELNDWTCCGATAAEPTSFLLSLSLGARNLALAEAMSESMDIMVPCSACYLNLKRVGEKIKTEPDLLSKVNSVLDENNLRLEGKIRVRHLLDIIINDIGTKTIMPLVKKRLTGFFVAPYYGCQCLRPYQVFDDPEKPVSMEPIIGSLGAEIHDWEMGAKCCGASHMTTKMDVGIELVAPILKAAKGADLIVTVCPMCQMNLEAYQSKASKVCGDDVSITILYLPQLIGLALGLTEKELRLDLNLSVTNEFLRKLRSK